jgi:NAD-dependent deacetylase
MDLDRIAPIDIAEYQNVFLLTGAGISVASGLSTYRGPGGLWERADVARIADARNLPDTLPDLWRLYRMRRTQALAAEPNAAHRAIAELQRRSAGSRCITLVTQNVDGLHQRAGSMDVLEMHGSAFRTRCLDRRCSLEPFRDEQIYDQVPTCPVCGGPLRPDVVLFSETIPGRVLNRIVEALATCNLFISVGTSGVVAPAAEFVRGAAYVGARTIHINVEPTDPPNPFFTEEFVGRSEEVLPRLFRWEGSDVGRLGG